MIKLSNFFLNKQSAVIVFLIFIFCFQSSFAQRKKISEDVKEKMNNQTTIPNNPQTKTRDTTIGFKHRDDLADSITISYRYLDTLRSIRLDSSLNDFNKFYSVPAHYITLGNNGSPGYPILFTPILKAGWDAGFHAYDLYRFTIENTKFYKTTRPYSKPKFHEGVIFCV